MSQAWVMILELDRRCEREYAIAAANAGWEKAMEAEKKFELDLNRPLLQEASLLRVATNTNEI